MLKISRRIALWAFLIAAFCQAYFLMPEDIENPWPVLCLIGFGCLMLALATWPEVLSHKLSLANLRSEYVRLAGRMPPLALALSVCGLLCMLLGGFLWLIL